MFFKEKKKMAVSACMDCNALRGLTFTGNVCILACALYSRKCLMPLKFCNQNKSFEKI